MNRVNKFISEYFNPDVAFLWDIYRHLDTIETFREPSCTEEKDIYFNFTADRREFRRVPDGVSRENWTTFVGLLADGFSDQSTFPLESWTMAGFCANPRVYCPSADDFMTLSRTECNVTFAEYRQPFGTFCVQIPDGVYGRRGFEFGAPACIIGRHSQVGNILSIMVFGTDGSRADLNMNMFFTWPSAERRDATIESLFRKSEALPREDCFEQRPGAEPLNDDET